MSLCTRHGSHADTPARPARCAVLVFAESAALFSAGRGWGPAGNSAADALMAHAIGIARRSAVGDVHVFTRGHSSAHTFSPLAPGLRFHRQQGDTFGRRLEAAVDAVHQMGYERVVIVGTDVPGLRAAHVRQAARLLESSPMALGADQRGGCYTMALHLSHAHVLRDIVWGEDTDFAELLTRRPDAAVLPQRLIDIDSTADLRCVLADTAYRLPGRLRAILQSFLTTARPTDCRAALPITIRAALRLVRQMWQLPPPLAA